MKKLSASQIKIILITAMIGLAFVWPWDAQPPAKGKSQDKKQGRATSQAANPDQGPAASETSKTNAGAGNADQDPSVNLPQVPEVPVIPSPLPAAVKEAAQYSGLAGNKALGNFAKGMVTVPPRPIVSPSQLSSSKASVARIQAQIQEILKINEGLRTQYREQASNIQKIMDQARIHRQILKDLDDKRVQQTQKPLEVLDPKEILRQEKIRLIQQQTLENQAFLENLKKENPPPEGENPEGNASPKPAAKPEDQPEKPMSR